MLTTKYEDQFFLNFKNKTVYDEKNFFVSNSNKKAYQLINNWTKWKGRKLIIIGQKGSGKTHLTKIWKKKTNAVYLNLKDCKERTLVNIFKTKKKFIIENISSSLNLLKKKKKKIEIEKFLLHFYNLVDENNSYAIITDTISPKLWKIDLPDLKSRLVSTLSVRIKQPDDNLLSLLLVKLFSDKQILIDKKIIKFIVNRSERSFENLQKIVEKIDKKSLLKKKKININLVKEII